MIIFKILGFFICFDILLVILIKFWQKIQVFLFMCKNCKHYKKIFINGLQVDMFGDIPEVALTCFENIPKKLIYSYSRHNFKVTLLTGSLFYTYATICGREDDCVGFFSPYRKEIVLNVNDFYFKASLFHEFGHFCDYLKGGLCGYASHIDLDVKEERKEQFLYSNFYDYYVENDAEFVAFCISEYLCKHQIPEKMVQIAKKYLQVSFDDAYVL